MTVTPVKSARTHAQIRWEPLPADYQLPDDPVESTAQPLLAGALRESLELANWIRPEMLVASNLGLCATVDEQIVVKAPDWLYVPAVLPLEGGGERRSYTPHLEGDVPALVMEFLSATEGEEYSSKQTYPPGKWYFYERILQVPYYAIFEPVGGLLEFYVLQNGSYQLQMPDENGRHWMGEMKLFLGTWRGKKEERTGYWLRWWDEGETMLPWAVEKVQELEAVAQQERQQKERLAAYLRSQGINPDLI